jgi:hypothetical protein
VDWHAATLKSAALGTLGTLHAVSPCIHAIGRASAWSRDRDPKHAVKQIDRLLSDQNVSVWLFSRASVRFVVGSRTEAVVAFDWTDFDADGHSTIAACLETNHGRATPPLWKTVEWVALEGRRNRLEDELLEELAVWLPGELLVTILADRDFGDQARHAQPRDLGMNSVIRFREGITLGVRQQRCGDRVARENRAGEDVEGRCVTADCHIVPAVVLVHDRKMKDAWWLATSRSDPTASEVTKL